MRKVLMLGLMLLFVGYSYSQANIRGLNVIEINYGLSKYSLGTFGQAGYGRYINEKFMLRTGINYENGFIEDRESLKFNLVYINAGNSYNIFTLQNKHGLNIYYGLLFGLENVESVKNEQLDRTMLYGINLGLEYGYVFNDRLGIKAKFEENYWHPSKLGKWNYVFTLGMNIYL